MRKQDVVFWCAANNYKLVKLKTEKKNQELFDLVCDSVHITYEELLQNNKNRERTYAWARIIIMSISKKALLMSFRQAGKVFDKHHSTCLYSVHKVEELLQWDAEFTQLFTPVLELLKKYYPGVSLKNRIKK